MMSSSLPNKPVLPTASNGLTDYAPDSIRRQTGEPLGSLEDRRDSGQHNHLPPQA